MSFSLFLMAVLGGLGIGGKAVALRLFLLPTEFRDEDAVVGLWTIIYTTASF